MDYITLAWKMAGLLIVLLIALHCWLTRMERRALSNWRQYAKDRGYPRAPKTELPDIEWDDGLSIAKLEVKHEPSREQP